MTDGERPVQEIPAMRVHLNRSQAFSFVEILVSVIFLALAGLAIYAATIHGVTASTWGAEKVMVEGFLTDMVQTYQAFDYAELSTRPEIKTSEAEALKDSAQVADVLQLSPDVFLPSSWGLQQLQAKNEVKEIRPKVSAGQTSSGDKMTDPIYKEYMEKIKLLGLKRGVWSKEVPAGSGTLVIHCVISYKSQAGPAIKTERSFVKFKS